ncbi:MAG: hypothetical protein K9J37_18555 [Saprospiraceae bacterium]|nr:hypothetical protein [Saprospiraceae bacterium]MCF8251923.1 hypothetical protein [Saprospiraceae bacterium]MCF8281623.1 hypothetical protein [Bacteroidales bacterium]MCF8313621.1 hypothetical protein [Saprospiraceae bacterium]MCF8442307.1 hypothetical protein [Saprospiraceae bacterium]
MTHGKQFFILILLTINLLACKNEPADTTTEAKAVAAEDIRQKIDSLAIDPSQTTQIEAPASAKPISTISKEQILLKDATQIALPKEDDKSSMVIFFATPAAKSSESTALSTDGLIQSTRLTRTLAQAGLTIIWVEGNTGMQTGLGVAKENAAEFNLIDPKTAGETLKTIVHNYMGKKTLVVASPAVLSELLVQLAGKKVVDVPASYSPVLYYAKVRGLGDADIMELSY